VPGFEPGPLAFVPLQFYILFWKSWKAKILTS
jgi:hypothetical protein